MEAFKLIALVIAGYLLGSINGSLLLTKGAHLKDIRQSGSGNAGATNMARVYGIGAGLAALCIDFMKALLVTQLGGLLLGDLGIAVSGFAVLLGHCFPLYHHFRGGKGVAVGAALALAIDWRVMICAVLIFMLAAALSKKVSLGSILSAVTVAVSSILLRAGMWKMLLACFGAAFVLFQHRANILRLFKGTEPNFRASSARKEK